MTLNSRTWRRPPGRRTSIESTTPPSAGSPMATAQADRARPAGPPARPGRPRRWRRCPRRRRAPAARPRPWPRAASSEHDRALGDAEHVELHLGRVGHDAAAEHVAGARDVAERGSDHPAGERLGDGRASGPGPAAGRARPTPSSRRRSPKTSVAEHGRGMLGVLGGEERLRLGLGRGLGGDAHLQALDARWPGRRGWGCPASSSSAMRPARLSARPDSRSRPRCAACGCAIADALAGRGAQVGQHGAARPCPASRRARPARRR